MEYVVSEPRVISNCLPVSTISSSLVGLLSRSTMLPASLAAWVPVVADHLQLGLPRPRWPGAQRESHLGTATTAVFADAAGPTPP